MFYLLFIFYFFLFCWLISRLKFFSKSGLSSKILITLFLLRVIASLVSNYFNYYYYQLSDPLSFHNYGIEEYNLLFSNPRKYLTNIFIDTRSNNYSGFFGTSNSFWNDTRSNVIIKLLSIFDIFSGKNFFINCLFYNFLVFFGSVALFKVFIKIFKKSLFALIICIFLLPSALFFSSMLHRDGLILLSLSMVIYNLFFILNENKFSWKRLVVILFFLLMILALRNFVFITLIPALLAWIIAHYKPKIAFISFLSVYSFIAIVFFSSGFISEKTNLPKYVSERQNAFIEIAEESSSSININPLLPEFKSFVVNAPQALNHSLMRPYIWEMNNPLYIPFIVEIVLFEILFILFIFFRSKNANVHPLIYFCIFFSATMFLVIGYTIPIIGAIVRYRSIYFIFLVIPIVCYMDWKKLILKLSISFKKI